MSATLGKCVLDICTRDVVTVGRDATVAECGRLMHDRHVGSVVVVDGASSKAVPVGVVTDRDIAIEVVAFGVGSDLICAADLMREPAVTIGMDADVPQAIETMREHGVRRLPVVDDRGELVGILSTDDLWDFVADQLSTLAGVIRKSEADERRTRSARAG